MNDEEQLTLTIPTELERRDGFIDLAILAGTVLVIWQGMLGYYLPIVGRVTIPVYVSTLLAIPVVLEVLTGEPAGDIQYIGAIATGLRGACGFRRAHEWIFAYLHYARVVQYPAAKVRCLAYLKSLQKRISAWQARLTVAMRHRRLRRLLWGYSTRYRLSLRRQKSTITTNGTSHHG